MIGQNRLKFKQTEWLLRVLLIMDDTNRPAVWGSSWSHYYWKNRMVQDCGLAFVQLLPVSSHRLFLNRTENRYASNPDYCICLDCPWSFAWYKMQLCACWYILILLCDINVARTLLAAAFFLREIQDDDYHLKISIWLSRLSSSSIWANCESLLKVMKYDRMQHKQVPTSWLEFSLYSFILYFTLM